MSTFEPARAHTSWKKQATSLKFSLENRFFWRPRDRARWHFHLLLVNFKVPSFFCTATIGFAASISPVFFTFPDKDPEPGANTCCAILPLADLISDLTFPTSGSGGRRAAAGGHTLLSCACFVACTQGSSSGSKKAGSCTQRAIRVGSEAIWCWLRAPTSSRADLRLSNSWLST